MEMCWLCKFSDRGHPQCISRLLRSFEWSADAIFVHHEGGQAHFYLTPGRSTRSYILLDRLQRSTLQSLPGPLRLQDSYHQRFGIQMVRSR